MSEDDYAMPARPRGVYLVTLWSFARAVLPVLLIIGHYRFYQAFGVGNRPIIEGAPLVEWFTFPTTLLFVLPLLAQAVVFLYLAIGILLGHAWARSGFLWASLVAMTWNLRGIVLPGSWSLYSLAPLPLATWYFRRPDVVEYFGAEDGTPRWLTRKVGSVPIDLAIALAVLGLSLVSEVILLITRWEELSRMF